MKKPTLKFTQEKLKELVDYNPDTGIFTNKINRINVIAGSVCGSLNHRGYIHIKINKVTYSAHRLAWLYIYGYCPENQIDHINRIRNDNRIKNLREVTHSCNLKNRTLQKNNKTGVKGVNLCKRSNKWRVQISNNKKIKTSYHKNFDDAVKKRWELEQKYNYLDCDKNSTALAYLKENGLI